MTHTRQSRDSASTIGPSKSARIITYGVLAVAFAILAVTGLLIYDSGKDSRDAQAKADQLTSQLQQFGLRTPSKDQIVRVLGTDGGAVCANPNNGLTRAALNGLLTNGAGGPGMRPVIADVRFLQGELSIISVYCPDQLQKFQEYKDSLKTAEVAG
jgi:hypothetical protein